ncbi:MAG TPA: 2-oxoglutarate dehydrogenase E1 component [Gemmatimonadota bacterium]|nr:2-oxoglutarate dehydrogenase E1 component [Gemmatimonadota bacterium]
MPSVDAILRASPEFVESMYRQFLADPDSVDPTWALFFAGFQYAGNGHRGGVAPAQAANGASAALEPVGPGSIAERANGGGIPEPVVLTARGDLPEGADHATVAPGLRVYDMVWTYRAFGHLIADLDPLDRSERTNPLLDLAEFGFSEEELDSVVRCNTYREFQEGRLREFLEALRDTYCGTVGMEYMDVADKAQQEWLQERMEPVRNHPPLEPERRREILRQMVAADTFEETLHRRFPGAKRFSLEGGTSLIPLLVTLVEESAATGVDEIVMGMAHRGRLNVLAHVLGKPYAQILAEFEDRPTAIQTAGHGDVKYHLGYSRNFHAEGGRTVHLSLAFNPSHLEAVDPVVEGNVRAKQEIFHDTARRRAIPLLLHGDVAFTGQGVVAETLMMGGLDEYGTGGTIHVIINNQVGFTTDPEEARSTRYASDIAKIVHAPVFHVNGDDPEAAAHAARLAVGYRQTFHRDVVIDLICYRRYGHNELDDPSYTQPVMYRRIDAHPSNSAVYAARLIDDGVIGEADVEAFKEEVRSALDAAHETARESEGTEVQGLGGIWDGLSPAGEDWSAHTAVPSETLDAIAHALVTVPDGFRWHKRLKRLMEARAAMVLEDGEIDWGCGEALAVGSLLLEGTKVRLAGQDTVRGTFSHRHAVYVDQESGEHYVPLNHMTPDQNVFHVINSPLSEYAALGFEYGFSAADPWTLVMWEAQFGDFVNGAQIVIDQFLSSGEYKWQRMSGLVLLLPHGYEGQGPEHSSARLERFMELCAENNVQVVYPTTPAQLFHLLRRQIHRDFRKPLVVMSPKSLLRHKLAVSRVAELIDGGFKSVLDEGELANRGAVRRILLCSGKVYYTLLEARRERLIEDTAIARLEQLYPFPHAELSDLIAGYPNLKQLVWVQEEPENMGAWRGIRHRLERHVPSGVALRYVGRQEAASPATGSHRVHEEEEAALVDAALED